MGITATPVDADDKVSVKISGVPKFETITASIGDVVTKKGSTYTITAPTGQAVSGLTLNSNYTGTGQPVRTLTVKATNSTAGEKASSASETIKVTDPPAATLTAADAPLLKLDALSQFSGLVSGFTGHDLRDLADIAFGSNTTLGYAANSNNTGGTLTVSNGAHTANLALLGQYMAASFVKSAGFGGTLIHDDPAQATLTQLTHPHA